MIDDPIKYVRDRSTEDADCWLWRQGCTSNGTPTMHQPHDSRRTIAVRRFLAAALGKDIAGKVVTNTCCDPRCVAPHHILVTDRSTLGKMAHQHSGYASQPARRAKIAATQRRRAGKLTPEQANEIRTGTERLRDVAERMGIAYATAHRIRTGKAWREYGSPFAGLMR